MHNSLFKQGSLLIDFSLALAFGIFFIYIISQLHSETFQIRSRTSLDNDFIEASSKIDLSKIDHSDISTTSKAVSAIYGNYFIYNSIISTTTRNIFALIKDNNLGPRDNRSLCFAELHNSAVFGSDADYSLRNGVSNLVPNVVFDHISLPIDVRNLPTDFEIRNNIAYISFDSNISSDPDLMIFDVNNYKQSKILGSIDSGPGISSFVLAGRQIYASALSTAFQLHVFDLNGPNDIKIKAKYKLPLPFATSSSPYGTSLDFHNPYIYLGTNKWEGEEFNQIEYKNNTFNFVNSFEIGSKVNEIYSFDNEIYLAGSNENQLVLFRNNIGILDKIVSFSGSGFNKQEGKSLDIYENILAFGRTSGGFDIKADPEIYLFSSSSQIIKSDLSLNQSGGYYGAVFDKDYVYLISHEVDKEFQIKDHALQVVFDYSLPIKPKKIVCDRDKIYILSGTSPDLYEISFQ